MTVTLANINLVLDVILKIVFLGMIVYLIILLRNIDQLVKSAERSAEEIGATSRKIGKLVTISRYLPLMGKKDE